MRAVQVPCPPSKHPVHIRTLKSCNSLLTLQIHAGVGRWRGISGTLRVPRPGLQLIEEAQDVRHDVTPLARRGPLRPLRTSPSTHMHHTSRYDILCVLINASTKRSGCPPPSPCAFCEFEVLDLRSRESFRHLPGCAQAHFRSKGTRPGRAQLAMYCT